MKPPAALWGFLLLSAACHPARGEPVGTAATPSADGVISVWVEGGVVHLANNTNDRIAYTVYDRWTLLVRSSDRDACMSAVAQCPSLDPRGSGTIPLRGVVMARPGLPREVAVRYWRVDERGYPGTAKVVTAVVR